MISRHFVDVVDATSGALRRVHYRKCGSGPPLLLVHQSPRSGGEYEGVMARWAAHFTCYAPDSPGFGDSAPLHKADPQVEDYADAALGFLDAMGLPQVGAYGFHSGAIILVTAVKRAAHRFSALACGGYAVWSEAEKADFGANYTPAFLPLPYGEHLAWLWGRILEQSWFFPWYRADDAARLPMANDDPGKVHPIVMEVLAAGDSFRLGYAAVLRANRDVPGPGVATPPVLLSAYQGDPLAAHLARLGTLPPNWRAEGVATPDELEALALAHLRAHPAACAATAVEVADEGFVPVAAAGFDGLIHWRGNGEVLHLHAPGGAASAFGVEALAVDLPGHGLSGDWDGAPESLADWAEVVAAAVAALGVAVRSVEGRGWSVRLAAAVAARLGVGPVAAADPKGAVAEWRAQGLPDLVPDRFGGHLQRGWQMLRAETFFEPWFAASAATARAFDVAEATPEALAVRHLALMRARAARPLLNACLDAAGG
ncbi:alpha/beta fold hydrolase [Sandaracinobacteroides saxicola]|uniref:Alpha/beta fold hydrolase n=1 Tax=Sandaracinobacteroides saxicola TaxID=2759707 RepID=A0A7G5IED2_9SPHN|nr:alpha/beta fold hydrolase [Sandaracinobacteroides saxicola]QMW21724.1 alpha/beta fold hydrolase [Sandaracinobacteroides saxicola]